MKSTMKSPRSAFTMIELMLVVLLIAIMSTIALGLSTYAKTMVDRAKSAVSREKIVAALEEYRAVYGEYPIPSNSRHYASHYVTDTSSNVPPAWSQINLLTNQIETMKVKSQGWGGTVRIDHTLTYPLCVAQKNAGREPFIEFPEETVMICAYRFSDPNSIISEKLPTGFVNVNGMPIKRYVAEDKATMEQWRYSCTDGRHYVLDTHPLTNPPANRVTRFGQGI